MTDYVVSAGVTSSDVSLNASDTMTVLSGGTAFGTFLTFAGAFLDVSSGGVASEAFFYGGSEVVHSGGSDVSAFIGFFDGSQTVYGTAISAVVRNNGAQFAASGGFTSGTIVGGGGSEVVYGGALASDTTVNDGGLLQVASGGTASDATISSNGIEGVLSGGLDIGATISSGGAQVVDGSASVTIIEAGGLQLVDSGGVANVAVVSGEQDVDGSASAATIYGFQLLESGGTATGDLVASGGQVNVQSGTASNATIASSGLVTVLSGGSAVSTTVNSGGLELVLSGANDVSATIYGKQTVDGGTASLAAVEFGGSQLVEAGGVTSLNLVIGRQDLDSGSALGTLVTTGGSQHVSAGGWAGADIVESGGVADVLSGGSAVNTEIDSDGTAYIESGGTADITTVNDGGFLAVFPGGTASHTTVDSGGIAEVQSGGIASSAIVNDGGFLNVLGRGSATETTLNSGAIADVGPDAIINSTTVNGGSLFVSSGIAQNTTVNDGGSFSDDGGLAEYTQVNFGGLDDVSSGGSDVSATVTDGGLLFVEAGGTAIDAVVEGGGLERVLSGGSDVSATIESGGSQLLSLEATAIDTFIASGGVQQILGGASDVSATIESGASQLIESGGIAIDTIVQSGGFEEIQSGTTSDVTIEGGKVELADGVEVSGSITFSGGGDLKIDDTTMPAATISGFKPGDIIDLAGVAYAGGTTSVKLEDFDVLTVFQDISATYELHLDPTQDFSLDTFQVADDGSGGTLVTEENTACYCRGTLILTPAGEVPVEELKIGDEVVTLSGATRPVQWIGRRSYSGHFILGRGDILPVCITAGAFADGVPRRDLWISPNHALYLDGVLIEAKDLVNGVSICQTNKVETVEYFHLELATHDVIFAEGAAAESYIDDDNRGLFHNAPEYWAAHPEPARGPAQYCAPRAEEGFAVERARAQIAVRAGLMPAAEALSPGILRGHIDEIGERIAGWALDEAAPDAPVCLDIYAGKKLIGQTVANRYRDDLLAAGIGDGHHGFEFAVPAGLAVSPRSVTVCRARHGIALTPSTALTQAGRRRRKA